MGFLAAVVGASGNDGGDVSLEVSETRKTWTGILGQVYLTSRASVQASANNAKRVDGKLVRAGLASFYFAFALAFISAFHPLARNKDDDHERGIAWFTVQGWRAERAERAACILKRWRDGNIGETSATMETSLSTPMSDTNSQTTR